MARALREAGVDLVVGAHAHMMQEAEHAVRGWIFSMKDDHLQAALRVHPIVTETEMSALDALLAEKGGWGAAIHSARAREAMSHL